MVKLIAPNGARVLIKDWHALKEEWRLRLTFGKVQTIRAKTPF